MKDFMNKLRIKKAVILEEGQTPKLPPLSIDYPIWMFPILNKPLIEYTIDFFKKNGFEEIIIALSEETEIPDYLKHNKVSGINIKYYKEDRPRGTAGILKDLEKFLGEGPFLVIVNNLFLGSIDLTKFIKLHMEAGSIATVGVYKEKNCKIEENVIINNNNMIKSFHIIHSSMDRRSPWKPSGVYLFNPSVLSFIDQKNYMDIKEQLIPALLRESLNVSAYEIEGFHRCLNNPNDYMNVHRALLLKNNSKDFVDKEEIAEGVWVGKNIQISPKAYLLGPIVIGEGCKIKDWAQIIGPTVIGNRCRISERVLIRESILWDGVSLSNNSKVEYSIVGGNSYIPKNLNIKNEIVLNGLHRIEANLIPPDYEIKRIVDLSGIVSITGAMQKLYKITKRIMDIVLSGIGIVLLLPLFFLMAIIIKIESPGPVFYIQKRCGKGGKLFGMIKFRSMMANAEKLHKDFIPLKEMDGPMFKISNDARITRLGKILRNTSIDELPQLFNVFKGEMSLVGPRPLITDEMKFSPSWRDIRLSVKPGMTGLWQVEARSSRSFQDWIKYDVDYVKNRSLWLDIKILFKTIKVVLKREGAY